MNLKRNKKWAFCITIKKVFISWRKPGRYFAPTLNARMHWAVRAQWTKAFKQAVKSELLQKRIDAHNLIATRKGKAWVRITFYSCRRMDQDNTYAAAKPLLDALKGEVILDDSPDKLQLTVYQEKEHHLKDQCTQIQILN